MVAVDSCRVSMMCRCGVLLALAAWPGVVAGAETAKVFRAGAAAVDITPQRFPINVAGSFLTHTAAQAEDRLHARGLVLDDGNERIVIVLVDTCVIPRNLLDEAKRLAHEATGIPTDRLLMAATHTHSAPAIISLLGTDADDEYARLLPALIAEAVQAAVANLTPARIGWTVVPTPEHTHCRRWIRRPDRIDTDPFGRQSVRAMMHPGWQNPDYLGPAGPVDPDISIVSVQSLDGRPLALLANYAMHYVGAKPLSADYFGAFAGRIAELIGDPGHSPPFVGIMSNGTSGDLHWMDYGQSKPDKPLGYVEYGEVIARQVLAACKTIAYHDWVPLAMREAILTLHVRPISDEDLALAASAFEAFKDRSPQTLPEVYAREQVLLSQVPAARELKLQALNIGGLGIAAVPCEVFGITGLRIKAQSPLTPTFIIELANGYDGYIPPPAQHTLGGYTTWRARSAGLEVEAEPKTVEAVLGLLEAVTGKPRRTLTGDDYPLGDYPRAVLASKPAAYWRLNEFSGPGAVDASGNGRHGLYGDGVAFYLEGPAPGDARADGRRNRAPHLAGGRIKVSMDSLADQYAIEMWFANYLPADARPVTGYLLARRAAGAAGPGDRLGIAGTGPMAGKLRFDNGEAAQEILFGEAVIHPKTWHHLVLARDGRDVTVYLDGRRTGDLAGRSMIEFPSGASEVLIGGGHDSPATFEGRIDEVAIYDRALSADEVAQHYAAAAGEP